MTLYNVFCYINKERGVKTCILLGIYREKGVKTCILLGIYIEREGLRHAFC